MRPVREIETAWIAMPDGARLAARIWLPADAWDDPVPAILEYLPYRRRDGTAARDALMHPAMAAHGYACVRVDMRGSGDSDGILADEYLALEQDDGCAIVAWLAAQKWCSGRVGMIGISWGGFNALQVAARRPPALAAIVTLCSTDDRYADDCHYMGGAVLGNTIGWGATMLAQLTRPPDPAVVGERWRATWLHRLDHAAPFAATWLRHQRRDAYWAQGSVGEDFGAIACPVLAVGGWIDAYTNAIPRLLAGLEAPCRAIIGPWAHAYPHTALPGPPIDFVRVARRWWDFWLKGVPNGVMDEPPLRAWICDAYRPATWAATLPGRWIAATAHAPAMSPRRLHLALSGLCDAPGEPAALPLCSPEDCGMGAGAWCPYGTAPDMPTDQREDDAASLVFDSPPLDATLELLGAPVLEIALSADRPCAKLVARLCEVFPDGASTRVSYGVLNLTHRDGHADPRPIVPGQLMRVRLALNDFGHAFRVGNRIRLALSSTYWPITWPTPERATLTILTGGSTLTLPVLPASTDALAPLPPPGPLPPAGVTALTTPTIARTRSHDRATGEHVLTTIDESGRLRIDATGLEYATSRRNTYRIRADDPLSARIEAHWRNETARGDGRTHSETSMTLTATATEFILEATLDAYEGEARVRQRSWRDVIPRDLV